MATAGEVFAKVCRRVLECWTALSLAAENNWGGGDGKAKREALIQGIIDSCLSQSSLDYNDMADALACDLESQYQLVLEDNSEVEIAQTIAKVHAACVCGDFNYPYQVASQLGSCNLAQCQGNSTDSDEEEDEGSTSPQDEHAPHDETLVQDCKDNVQATSATSIYTRHGQQLQRQEDGWTTIL